MYDDSGFPVLFSFADFKSTEKLFNLFKLD